MNTTTRITIPVDEEYRKKLAEKADNLGFDSIQAMFRYIGKALIDGRKVEFGEGDFEPWGSPPEHVVKEWEEGSRELEADMKSGKAKIYKTPKEALDALHALI